MHGGDLESPPPATSLGVGRLQVVERKPDAVTAVERTVTLYDDMGNRIHEELQRADTTSRSATDYTYRTGGCLVEKVIRAPGTTEESVTEYDYDCNGNLTDVWDANHPRASFPTAPLRYQYDALNRLVKVNQTSGGSHPASTVCDGSSTTDLVTCYGYDVQDHLMEVEDAERNVTEYAYSDRDLLTDQDSQATGPSALGYNEHGELAVETDARNVTVTRIVDAADRVMLVNYPDDALDTAYAYGADPMAFEVGRLVGITRDGETVAYTYDRFGRVLQDGDLSYTYDENSNRQTITYPGGLTATYDHDGSDREVSLSVPGQTLVSGATYLPSGPLASLTLGNGLTETRSFDERYFPSGIELSDVAPLLEWSYTDIDAIGNIKLIEDLVSSDPADDRSFGYQDHQYFLTCAAGPWIEEGASCDPVSTDPVPFQWTYDRIGNRLTEQREEPPEELPGFVPLGVLIDDYLYEQNTSSGNSPILDEVDLGGGASRFYTFGLAGHLEQLEAGANVVALTIDAAGRVSRFQRSMAGGGSLAVADVTYDGRGFLREVASLQTVIFQDGFETGDTSCWSSTVGDAGESVGDGCPPPPTAGPAVEAVYDSQGLLHSITRTPSGGSPIDEYVFYFGDRPIAQLTDDGTTQSWQFLTADHLGAPAAGTDDSGALLWDGGFEPFGAAVETGTFLRLPGQWTDPSWQDAASGLNPFYNVYRWYESGTGRYTRSDPALEGPLAYSDMSADSWPPGTWPSGQPVEITVGSDSVEFGWGDFGWGAAAPEAFVDDELLADFGAVAAGATSAVSLEVMQRSSVYVYGLSNPLGYVDPTGEWAWLRPILRPAFNFGKKWGPKAWQFCKRVRCNIKLDRKPHAFPSLGGRRLPHLQLNCWLKGVKGSDIRIRLPLPRGFFRSGGASGSW